MIEKSGGRRGQSRARQIPITARSGLMFDTSANMIK